MDKQAQDKPKVFKQYKPPATVVQDDGEKKKKEDGSAVASLQLSPIDINIPADFDSSQEKSSTNVSLPIKSNVSKPKGSLRVPDDTYRLIDICSNKIHAVAQRRESVTRLHESVVAAINSSITPHATRIRDRPPAIQGVDYSVPFLQQYKAKCLTYSIHLGVLLVEEYKTLAIKLSTEIDQLLNEGESSLASITDEDTRKKAVKLLHIKYQAALRRASRRIVKAHRRRPNHQ